MKDVYIKAEITGYLRVTPEDAEILKYMFSIDTKEYAKMLGIKYRAEDYTELFKRLNSSVNPILEAKDKLNKALQI